MFFKNLTTLRNKEYFRSQFECNPDTVGLQAQIDNISRYSYNWGLKINVNKTKICIFEKRKRNINVDFYVNNEKIDIVDNFTYLGVQFTHTGNLINAVKALSDQAL